MIHVLPASMSASPTPAPLVGSGSDARSINFATPEARAAGRSGSGLGSSPGVPHAGKRNRNRPVDSGLGSY
jgi:hypothetical protein